MSTVPMIDLGSSDVVSGQVPVRRLISLVLLLAVKDQATEVRFEPSEADDEWKVRYEVDGEWYDMAPVPLDVPISREIRRLAGMSSGWWNLFGWRDSKAANEATIRLRIAGNTVGIKASLHRSGSVVLRLPQQAGPTDDAARLLGEFLDRWRDQHEPA